MIRIIPSKDAGALLTRRAAKLDAAEAVVRPILDAVRNRGDDALLEYARRFDRLERPSVVVSAEERAASLSRLQPEFVQALETAAVNIRAFASRQLPREYLEPLSPGLFAGQIVRPLDTVAAYIPGGRYPLPSTLMMTLIPAQVAGVPRMYFCCPRLVDEVFGTGHWLGATDAFLMGGAHAIAAFAFGTESVPRADR
ncbi:MAG TPA: histidinol dehydrogenase, partial [Solibacterales bacterium]|nr:histidinol dehydrogenase [Bryobacterales bacterium]